jgi:hypothetical protein
MVTANQVFRDYETDGVPSSGAHEVKKAEVRELLGGYETIINAFLSDGGMIYTSKASLDADLAHGNHSSAWVIGDPVAANNGVYMKVGASGTGLWTRVADLPFSFIIASDTGAGTPNAIQATTSIPVSGSALVWMNIFEANTSSPVTVSFNGGSALTIKTNSGNDVVAGGLVAGMIVLGIVSGINFRLLNDQVSSSIVAAAEGWANIAQAAANNNLAFPTKAAASAATIDPSINVVTVRGNTSEEDGFGGPYGRTNTGSNDTFVSGGDTWYRQPGSGFDFDITVTVGPGGQFSTINAALEMLSLLDAPRYIKNGVTAQIRLLSGFVMMEQIAVYKRDFGWITITADDPLVTIDRASLSEPQYNLYFPAFTAAQCAVLPSIAALFEMNTTGSPTPGEGGRSGIFVVDNSKVYVAPGAGVRKAEKRGLHIANGSIAIARATDFREAGEACVRAAHSIVEVRNSILTGGYKGLMVAGLAVVDAEGANVSNSTYAGIENIDAYVRFGSGSANNCNIALIMQNGVTTARSAQLNNALTNAVELREGARANLRSCLIQGALGGQAVYNSGSDVFLGNANLNNANGHAITADGGKVEAPIAVLTNAGRSGTGYAVNAVNGGKVNAQGADGSGAAGLAGNAVSFMINNGSEINANGATGTAGRTINTLSRHGIIYKE